MLFSVRLKDLKILSHSVLTDGSLRILRLILLILHHYDLFYKLRSCRVLLFDFGVRVLLVLEGGRAILMVDVYRYHLAYHLLVFSCKITDILGMIGILGVWHP